VGSGDFEDVETHLLRSVPRQVSFRRYRLVVLQGMDTGLTAVCASDEMTVGTAQGNDLLLHDPAVSRHHCRVTFGPRGFSLRDLGSANGIVLGGHRVESAYLEPGSVFSVGTTLVRFDLLDDQVTEAVSADAAFGRVLGRSVAMRRLFALAERIAPSESTVLVEGETGTGKGALAEAIHARSARAGGPFVVIDCGAIPQNLVESELFGHERGAFTGAHSARPGAFEAAAGGTVFLDEIGELPLAVQPRLLRALEARVVQRVGSRTPTPLDVRVIAATNRELRAEVNRGTFRADLFFRLNIVRVALPPLRERAEDIGLLAEHFFRELGPPGTQPSPALLESYRARSWPGNVRELRNAVERDVVLGEGASLDEGGALDAATPSTRSGSPDAPFRVRKEQAIRAWENAYLRDLLEAHGGNLTHAARAARMDRNYLRELLRRHGIAGRDDG
jgi:DNA-binding NtrC family response regulator